jgi:hypothetical protein
MAQENVRSADAITNAGVESSFAVAATTGRLAIVSDSFEPMVDQSEVENDDESIDLYDDKVPILGLKAGGGCNFAAYWKVMSALLTTGTLTVPKFHDLVRTLMGGMSPAAGANVGGTTTASPGTATVVDLVSAANFAAGQMITIPTANGMEVARIESIASNALTLNPGLSTTPSANAAVAHCLTFFADPGNALTATIEHAKSTNIQYRFLGCTGDFEIGIARNSIITASFKMRAANFQRGALSLTTTASGDGTGGSILKGDGSVFLLQAAATATPTHYSLEEIGLKITAGMEHLPDEGGTKNGYSGVMRTGARKFAEITATFSYDAARVTEWTNRTALQCGMFVPQGSGATRQWFGFHAPLARIIGAPKPNKSGNRERLTVTLRPYIDSSKATALLKSPLVLFNS